MKIDYVKTGDVTGEITINVVESDYAEKVKKELKEIGKRRPEPGFRPGHVPAGLLEKKYGKAAKYEVLNSLVADALFDYIKEQNLHVLGNPVAHKENAIDEDANEFTLKFTVGLAPEFNVKADKDVKVPYYDIEITKEMIDRQDEAMRRRFGKQVPGDEVDATALVKGVITELNEDGTVKEGGVVVENGIVAPQYFKSEDQRKLFLGKHVGDELVFNPAATCDANATELSSMLNVNKEEAENYKGDFRFDIKEIIVLKPAELGEEYYKDAFGEGVKDEKEYKEAIKNMIKASLVNDENYRFTIDAKKALLDKAGNVELPDEVIKDFLVSRNEGLTAENIDEEYAKMREEIVWDLLTEQLMQQLDVKVSEEDLMRTAMALAHNQLMQFGMTGNVPEDVLKGYAEQILRDEKARNSVVNQTAENNFYTALRNAVKLDEKKVSVEGFNDLFK